MATPTAITAPALPISLPPRAEIETFCRRWGVAELALFGSVLRDDFRADSDLDVLVTLNSNSRPGLLDWERMRAELSALFGRAIDLVDRASLELSRDARRKREIIQSARVVHVAGR